MATAAIKLDSKVQTRLLELVANILTTHKTNSSNLRDKMESIDIAYARYNSYANKEDGEVECNIMKEDDVIAPIVVSEVDTMVAYLTEVFLSGSPLFPVVSTPRNRKWAEQLETLIDDHANLGGYVRHLIMFIIDAVKYNFSAIEANWEQIDQFTVDSDFQEETGRKVSRAAKKFTKLRRLDPYNTIWDNTIPPADVAQYGDFAGDIQIISRTKLKRIVSKLKAAGKLLNEQKAIADNTYQNAAGVSNNYNEKPTISRYIAASSSRSEVNWAKWFGDGRQITGPNNFELLTLYVRIIPSDFLMPVPQPSVPQIWKLQIINSKVMISAERIISASDYLPIMFGQPLEDGMGLQTKSIAEGSIPFQEACTTLYNIRFAAARRSVSDRALYDPDMINPSDINKPVPAPKIPVRGSAMKEKALAAAYMQIPFDMRGTETTLQDATTIANFSKDLNGINAPMRGQFQKGNKSVTEWNDTMSGADGRMRLRALCLEYQVFLPLKENIKLNIFQYGEDAVVVSQKNGAQYDIKIDELRKQVLAFKVADGYSPKSKLASMDTLTMGFQMISQSPILQQQYGTFLPGIFEHMMSLGGVKGFEEYNPQNPENQVAGNLPGNTLQGTAAPAGTSPTNAAVAPAPDPNAPAIVPNIATNTPVA